MQSCNVIDDIKKVDQLLSNLSLASFIFVARYVDPSLSGWLFIIRTRCLCFIEEWSVLSTTPIISWAYLRVIYE